MPKYLKDKKIMIADEDYHIIHPGKLWAYYRQLAVDDVEIIAGIVARPERVMFVINWRDDVHEGMCVSFRGQAYGITRVDDYEGYKRDLQVYCGNVIHWIQFEGYQG